MNLRLPEPPVLASLSAEDDLAFRRWAAELNRQITVIMQRMTAANGLPLWNVPTPSNYPHRTLQPGHGTPEIRDALGTLLVDLKAKGIIA
jgi:hypothetical protein